MDVHAALDQLMDLEERVGRVYTELYARFAHLPAVAELWWEMALEEHGHAGILKMVKALTDRGSRVADIRSRLRPLQALIRECERQARRDLSLREALSIAVRLERSELDRLGRETMRGIARDLSLIPRAAFAPHDAHLERLTRTVRKFGGEDVIREAWALSADARTAPAERMARDRSPARRSMRPKSRGTAPAARPKKKTTKRLEG